MINLGYIPLYYMKVASHVTSRVMQHETGWGQTKVVSVHINMAIKDSGSGLS